jgi:hypothetical protein
MRKVSEFGDLVGVSPSTLRRWEEEGIAFTRLLKYTRTFYIKTSSFKNVPHAY